MCYYIKTLQYHKNKSHEFMTNKMKTCNISITSLYTLTICVTD